MNAGEPHLTLQKFDLRLAKVKSATYPTARCEICSMFAVKNSSNCVKHLGVQENLLERSPCAAVSHRILHKAK